MPDENMSLADLNDELSGSVEAPESTPEPEAAPSTSVEAGAVSNRTASGERATAAAPAKEVDDDEWPELKDETPVNPFEKFKSTDELKKLTDPQQLSARAEAAYKQIGEFEPRIQALTDIESKAEAIGGIEHVPAAVEMTALLFGGNQPAAEGQAAPLDQFLDKVEAVHEQTYQDMFVALVRREPELLFETFAPVLMQRLGLNAENLEKYQMIDRFGVYSPDQDNEAEQAFLGSIDKKFHDAYRAMPLADRQELQTLSRESAVRRLNSEYRLAEVEKREQAREATEKQQAEQATAQAQQKTIQTEEKAFQDKYIEKAVALGLPKAAAKGIVHRADEIIQEMIAAEGPDGLYGQPFREFGAAVKSGNRMAMDRARRAMAPKIETAWRQAFGELKPERKSQATTTSAGTTKSAQRVRDTQGRFTPDEPTSDDEMNPKLGLEDIAGKMGRLQSELTR